MPRFNTYNLYDNGVMVMENVVGAEIIRFLGCSKSINFQNYADINVKFRGRYTFELNQHYDETATTDMRDGFCEEWEEAVRPFKRVIWVKTGGRKLCIRK